ncbi:MAG: YbbR-like domain-containing protein [Bacteroidales bacterium]|nr:YbbR-like domain-containing protein [Bacteroidales bacterium]MBP5683059.1 YbbR-like domain-containing protein [Bacteroidales bacterium]
MAEKKTILRRTKAFLYRLKRKRFNKNTLTYLVMTVIALTFWFINKISSTITTEANFKVEYYGLPNNSMLVPGITTDMLRITISARGGVLLAHRGDYSPIRIDLSKLDIRTFPESDSTLKFVTDDDIKTQVEAQIPDNYKFKSLKPDTIKLDFGIMSHIKVPVKLDYDISCEKQYRLASAPQLQPDSITIGGPALIIDTITAINTERLVLNNLKESTVQKVRFLIPDGIDCPLTSTDASINVEKFTENAVEVPIRTVNVPDTVTLRFFSQKATIRFNVGWSNYNKITREMFAAEIDFNDLLGFNRPQFLTVRITKKPEDMGVTNITISPETVEYIIEKKTYQP